MSQLVRKRMSAPHFLLFLLTIVFVSSAVRSSVVFAQAAKPTRTFIFEDKRSVDPIQLVGFRVEGKMVDTDTPFPATDEGWLRDSVMVIKNVSQREVVAVYVFLFFPETGDSQPMVGDQVDVGSPPPEGRYTRDGKKLDFPEKSDLSLLPGQTLEIHLGLHFAGYSTLVKQRKALQDLSVCHVRFVSVYFADGLRWSPNYFGRPDPDHIGQYIRILPSEFYEYSPSSKSN